MHLSTRAVRVLLVGMAVAATVTLVQRTPQAQQPQPYTKWDQFGGASDSMQYSALAQINKSNVKQLQRAWFYPVPGEPDRLQFNPLIVDNIMYVSGVRGVVVALDATTGKELWMSTLQAPNRGLAYWESKDRSDRRLILTASSGIRELDARTGRQILTFGTNGFVDMRIGAPRRNGGPNSSPGRIFENLLIVGSNVGEGYGSPPGDIRAYDVLTGKLAWTFHTVPRPGEYGYETWPEAAFRYAGGANTWGDLTLDEKNGIIFLPTGSPTHDLYGGDRQGDNLFGNCLLALDARTGKRLWHFQIVHHDLWDYDNAASPKLLTVQHNGKPLEIVAQAGKTGFLYVFERKTGKPLWPIEERPVPKSEVPGEYSSPTQPFPTKPPPFARQSMTPEEVNPFVSPEEQEKLKQLVREAANEGVFTPSSHLRPHIQFPGAWGGANWGSVAGDPQTGMVYVRSLEMISYRKMSLVEPGRGGGGGGGGRGQGAAPLGPREQAGQSVYTQRCSTCHGAGQMPMRSIKVLGSEGIPFGGTQRRQLDARISRERHLERRARGSRVLFDVAAHQRGAGGQSVRDSAAAESESVPGTPDALWRIVLSRLVYEQRLSGHRAAVVAARRVRPERRHDQMARRRRHRARRCGSGEDNDRHRKTAEQSGRDSGRARLPGQFAGLFSPRVRQDNRGARVGARAGSESRRHAGRLPGEWTAVHRLRGWRVLGNGRRSGVEKSSPSQASKNRSAGLSRICVAGKTVTKSEAFIW